MLKYIVIVLGLIVLGTVAAIALDSCLVNEIAQAL